MWLLKWWAWGRLLTVMPPAPAAKSSPAHLSELPSLGSQVDCEFLKAACWVGSCCILVSAKADKGAQRRHSWGSCLDGNESITVPAETHSHVPAPCIASPVKLMTACLLNFPLLLPIFSLHVLVCVFISSLCDLFSLCLSLHMLPPTLPWCSACCSIKAAKMKNASSDVHIGAFLICLFGFSFLFCLMLVSVKYGWKEKNGMLEHFCPGDAGSPELPWSEALRLCLHPGRQVPELCSCPCGTEATYRNQSSLNKIFVYEGIWEMQTKI